MDLQIIERINNNYPDPVLVINSKTNSLYFSKKAVTMLGLKNGSGVIFSINKLDNSLWVAVENEISGGKKAYSFNDAGGMSVPKNLKYHVEDGIFHVSEKPKYQQNYDWFECEPIEYE